MSRKCEEWLSKTVLARSQERQRRAGRRWNEWMEGRSWHCVQGLKARFTNRQPPYCHHHYPQPLEQLPWHQKMFLVSLWQQKAEPGAISSCCSGVTCGNTSLTLSIRGVFITSCCVTTRERNTHINSLITDLNRFAARCISVSLPRWALALDWVPQFQSCNFTFLPAILLSKYSCYFTPNLLMYSWK